MLATLVSLGSDSILDFDRASRFPRITQVIEGTQGKGHVQEVRLRWADETRVRRGRGVFVLVDNVLDRSSGTISPPELQLESNMVLTPGMFAFVFSLTVVAPLHHASGAGQRSLGLPDQIRNTWLWTVFGAEGTAQPSEWEGGRGVRRDGCDVILPRLTPSDGVTWGGLLHPRPEPTVRTRGAGNDPFCRR